MPPCKRGGIPKETGKRWGSSGDHVRRLWKIPQKARLVVKRGQPPPPSGKNSEEGEGRPVTLVCLGLGRPALDGSWRFFTRFGGVKTTVIRLAEEDAARLLQLVKVKIGWVACRIREHAEVARCFRCLGYGYGSWGCGNPDRKNACWRCGTTRHLARSCKAPPRCLTCLDRGDKDIAHVPCGGSCPVFKKSFRD